jgi:ElaB/YqjD/DUF883 family membrane-anchored ribosome-binding protein
VSTVAEAAAPTINKLSDTAHKVMDTVSSGTSQAAAMMHEKTPQMKDPKDNVMADTLVRIRENPVTAVAIAAGAGYILGRLAATAQKVVDKVSTVAKATTPTFEKLSDTAQRVVDKVSIAAAAATPTIDKLSDSAQRVVGKVSTAAEAAAPAIDKLSDTAHKVMRQATARMQEKRSRMKDPKNKVMADTIVRARENPIAAVAVAAGAAYILSRMMRR